MKKTRQAREVRSALTSKDRVPDAFLIITTGQHVISQVYGLCPLPE
jgi:hypothetical protein